LHPGDFWCDPFALQFAGSTGWISDRYNVRGDIAVNNIVCPDDQSTQFLFHRLHIADVFLFGSSISDKQFAELYSTAGGNCAADAFSATCTSYLCKPLPNDSSVGLVLYCCVYSCCWILCGKKIAQKNGELRKQIVTV